MNIRSRGAVVGAVASLMCVGLLFQGSAAQALTETDPAPADSSLGGGVVATGNGESRIVVDFNLSRVTLTQGRVLDIDGILDAQQTDIAGTVHDAVRLHADGPEVNARFAYRISMLGELTDYWVDFRAANHGRQGYPASSSRASPPETTRRRGALPSAATDRGSGRVTSPSATPTAFP